MVKVLYGNQITKPVAKTIVCPPQSVNKPSLLKTIPIQFIEHAEVELMPT